MAAQRQFEPEPPRPPLRLVTSDADTRVQRASDLDGDFGQGLRWGLLLSTLGFWLPVAVALYVWRA